mgnify:CR=1 FL=1
MPFAPSLRRLLRYAHAYRGRVALASTWSILKKLFDIAPPLLIGTAIDVVVKREESILARVGVTDVHDQLWVLAGLTLLIWALESLET